MACGQAGQIPPSPAGGTRGFDPEAGGNQQEKKAAGEMSPSGGLRRPRRFDLIAAHAPPQPATEACGGVRRVSAEAETRRPGRLSGGFLSVGFLDTRSGCCYIACRTRRG